RRQREPSGSWSSVLAQWAASRTRSTSSPARQRKSAFEADPHLSTKRAASLFGVSDYTVRRIFRRHNLHAYKVRVLHELKPEDYERRLDFCREKILRIAANPSDLDFLLFSDEAQRIEAAFLLITDEMIAAAFVEYEARLGRCTWQLGGHVEAEPDTRLSDGEPPSLPDRDPDSPPKIRPRLGFPIEPPWSPQNRAPRFTREEQGVGLRLTEESPFARETTPGRRTIRTGRPLFLRHNPTSTEGTSGHTPSKSVNESETKERRFTVNDALNEGNADDLHLFSKYEIDEELKGTWKPSRPSARLATTASSHRGTLHSQRQLQADVERLQAEMQPPHPPRTSTPHENERHEITHLLGMIVETQARISESMARQGQPLQSHRAFQTETQTVDQKFVPDWAFPLNLRGAPKIGPPGLRDPGGIPRREEQGVGLRLTEEKPLRKRDDSGTPYDTDGTTALPSDIM
ncbi:hypothetical protein HPB47_023415, partial [Ixodes persulcatus]